MTSSQQSLCDTRVLLRDALSALIAVYRCACAASSTGSTAVCACARVYDYCKCMQCCWVSIDWWRHHCELTDIIAYCITLNTLQLLAVVAACARTLPVPLPQDIPHIATWLCTALILPQINKISPTRQLETAPVVRTRLIIRHTTNFNSAATFEVIHISVEHSAAVIITADYSMTARISRLCSGPPMRKPQWEDPWWAIFIIIKWTEPHQIPEVIGLSYRRCPNLFEIYR